MKSKYGFTLAETLLTLVILGIVTSMTIPVVIQSQQNRENLAGYHRAVNVLNSAFSEYHSSKSRQFETKYREVKNCPEGTHLFNLPIIGEFCAGFEGGVHIDPVISEEPYLDKSAENLDPSFIGEIRLNSDELILNNIMKSHMNVVDTQLLDANNPIAGCENNSVYFYTGDGMRYCMQYSPSASINDNYGEKTYGVIWVDVNGEKGPNKVLSQDKKIGDTFPIVMMKNRFIPGHPTNNSYATSAQDLFFGKK